VLWRGGGLVRCDRFATASLAPTLLVLALAAAACSDDEDRDGVEPVEPATETTTDIVAEPTPALELNTSADPSFIDDILADEQVTASELEDGYERFIACLTDGGAAGIYAYDIELHITLAADWSLALDTAGANDAASLEASCAHDYLGDLIDRYEQANPAPPDLVERQRASVVRCVAAVNPTVADAIPDVMSVDTTGAGANAFDLQLDPASLGAEPGEVEAIRRCLGSLGAEWTQFG